MVCRRSSDPQFDTPGPTHPGIFTFLHASRPQIAHSSSMASSSRIPHLLGLIKSLPATPLRPAGSPQLSNALESIVNRISSSSSSSSPSTTATGSIRGDPVEGMIGALERLKANKARDEVRRISSSPPSLLPPYSMRAMTVIKLRLPRLSLWVADTYPSSRSLNVPSDLLMIHIITNG